MVLLYPPYLPPCLLQNFSVAVAAPQVYHTVAEAFAAAVKCLTLGGNGTVPEGDGEGEWGGRPALKDAAVRVSLTRVAQNISKRLDVELVCILFVGLV